MDLTCAVEIACRTFEILRHDAEVDVIRAEDVADLAEHFLDAHVGAGVARTVVACEEEAKFFAGCPAAAETEHPGEAADFDERADPGDQEEVGHAWALPATMDGCATGADEGHGFAG